MLHLSQQQRLLQKLTPQQVQYLKLLQLPVLALEQRIKAELEQNPLLEETEEDEVEQTEQDTPEESETTESSNEGDDYTLEDFMNDDLNGYKTERLPTDHEEKEELPLPSDTPLLQRLLDQVHFQDLDEQELLLAEEIVGNIDEDGYLRRELSLIVQDLNLSRGLSISIEKAERVLGIIQRLDPPGIGARTLQECLLVQLEIGDYPAKTKERAGRILRDHFESFTMKHYEDLAKKLSIHIDQLKPVIDLIHKLNPKPGEGEIVTQQNYVVPDFIVERVDEELVVMLNDRTIPPLRLNKAYKEMVTRKKNNGYSSEAKDFIRKKFEAAKWFIISIHQRRDTLIRVMRAIVEKQRQFFETGEGLKPLIYKDIAEITSLDISTISRVVNGKYVQTEHGMFELRYFFSDSISTTSGEEIANKEVKKLIKEMIEQENTSRPLSDDRIAETLRDRGFNIARRTVAKYREQMRIPVARLRRKL
jgi:RNA polymerase sigma-54 factor